MINAVITAPATARYPALPALSRHEWQAIAIALRDAESAGCAARAGSPGRIARLFHWLTGIEPRRPLANPRLEALRRYVCTLRRERHAPDHAIQTLIDLGYSRRQLDAIDLLAF